MRAEPLPCHGVTYDTIISMLGFNSFQINVRSNGRFEGQNIIVLHSEHVYYAASDYDGSGKNVTDRHCIVCRFK